MIVVGIYIKDAITSEYNRVELFNDEKISVNSSIQNVNDISKTYTDFSQTFTVPASKQNNKIFRHWYENSNDNGFTTLTKADAYIEIDTIPFRSGKIQLESANVKDGQPQDYSITFIGALGSLKDKFNGLYLKDLTDTTYDFEYTAANVKTKVTTLTPTSPATPDIAFPLITSSNVWEYGSGYDISATGTPIRYNDLFPAIKLSAVLNMIANDSNILNLNFNGSFLSDSRFTNAYLYLKNSDLFNPLFTGYSFISSAVTYNLGRSISTFDVSTNTFNYVNPNPSAGFGQMNCSANFTARTPTNMINKKYWFEIFYNGKRISITQDTILDFTTYGYINANALPNLSLFYPNSDNIPQGLYTYKFSCENTVSLTNVSFNYISSYGSFPPLIWENTVVTIPNYTYSGNLLINSIMPEIKIEDFFSGFLKMFNLTCYSSDGINYTIEQLENYYTSGTIRDITKYIKSDSVNLNRVKTYKKINFEYEKSDSLVNVGFNSANGIEYGSLFYNTNNDGDEYNIKLPFENLNFSNLKELLQVGYALKTDYQKYIPKPVILYDYNPTALTTLTAAADFYFNTNVTGGTSTLHTTYKAFGQEYFDGTNTYSLNFNQQQSTLTNELISNSLYNEYYENYLANIFDSKARLIKVSGILPTSLLTTLKLNDRLIIRDKRYLINTFTTDLTTGEVQFELLTDNREL